MKPNHLPVCIDLLNTQTKEKCNKLFYLSITSNIERNNLSFIETSALDSTNVETAFQNILTGILYAALIALTFKCLTVDYSTSQTFS
jgi:hypothetical protein